MASKERKQWEANNLKPGEVNAGVVFGQNGEPDYILIVLADRLSNTIQAKSAAAWANAVGGELPSVSGLCAIRANTGLLGERPLVEWSASSDSPIASSEHYKKDIVCMWRSGLISIQPSSECMAFAVRKVFLN